MRPPRNRMLLSRRKGNFSTFQDYACMAFSEYVSPVSSEADTVLAALDNLLRTNVLSWIEYVAQKDKLYYIVRTAKNLKDYLGRLANFSSSLGTRIEKVNAWGTDLTRLVAKFVVALLTVPSAIYFLILPLCPMKLIYFRAI